MKLSEAWLREWVDTDLALEALCDRLTMTGLEVEGVEPVSEPFAKVVVGKVLHVKKHNDSDQLHICEVEVGMFKPLTIVCGAANVKAGMKVAAALAGATLPN